MSRGGWPPDGPADDDCYLRSDRAAEHGGGDGCGWRQWGVEGGSRNNWPSSARARNKAPVGWQAFEVRRPDVSPLCPVCWTL